MYTGTYSRQKTPRHGDPASPGLPDTNVVQRSMETQATLRL